MNEDGETQNVINAIQFLKQVARDPGSQLVSENKAKHKILHSLVTEIYVQPAKRTPRDKTSKAIESSLANQNKRNLSVPNSVGKTNGVTGYLGDGNTDYDLSYCCDCYLPLECDPAPWASMRPNKACQKRGHGKGRCQAKQQMEEYLRCITRIYGSRSMIPFGLHKSQLNLLRRARLLGQIASDIAPTNPIENWTPREIAVFEAAISVFGKEFHMISDMIRTKSTQEVVEFYYEWKFSSHYYSWKAHYKGLRSDTSLNKK